MRNYELKKSKINKPRKQKSSRPPLKFQQREEKTGIQREAGIQEGRVCHLCSAIFGKGKAEKGRKWVEEKQNIVGLNSFIVCLAMLHEDKLG